MTFPFYLKFLTHEQCFTLYKVFSCTLSFDAQSDLPEIGKEVLIYKGGSRNRNFGRVSHLPLSPDFLILFIEVLRAFSQ